MRLARVLQIEGIPLEAQLEGNYFIFEK